MLSGTSLANGIGKEQRSTLVYIFFEFFIEGFCFLSTKMKTQVPVCINQTGFGDS